MRNLLASASLDFIYIRASAPDAPPLSDTTIGCFIRLFFCTAACSMRAIWSEAPPAPAATTTSTGFDASHAMADPAMETASSVPAQTLRLPDSLDMALPFLNLSRGDAGFVTIASWRFYRWASILRVCTRGSSEFASAQAATNWMVGKNLTIRFGARALQAHRQHPGDMQGTVAGPILDLLAAP